MNRNMGITYKCGMMESSNLDWLSSTHSPLTSIWILNSLFSILLPQISFIQPQFSIFNFSSSILSQNYGKFDSKCLQNIVIPNQMSASAATSFFQVCQIPEILTLALSKLDCGTSFVNLYGGSSLVKVFLGSWTCVRISSEAKIRSKLSLMENLWETRDHIQD